MTGVYTSQSLEIAESAKWAIALYGGEDGDVLGAKLYFGTENEKRLIGIAERRKAEKLTLYAFEGPAGAVVTNDPEGVRRAIGERLAPPRDGMRLIDEIRPSGPYTPPTVTEAGIESCLFSWRLGVTYDIAPDHIGFSMVTDRIEYVFSIRPEDTNIYCGASINIPRPEGLFGQGQYFRLRNFGDNSAPFCAFFADLGGDAAWRPVPKLVCENGDCTNTDDGIYWPVKRFTDEEIVLAGCGGDEYVYYRRDGAKREWFAPPLK